MGTAGPCSHLAGGFGSRGPGDVMLGGKLAACWVRSWLEMRRQPLRPQEHRGEARLPLFRAAPLSGVPVPGSTSSSRGGSRQSGEEAEQGQEASPSKRGPAHLPGIFTSPGRSLFLLFLARRQRRMNSQCVCWSGGVCRCSDTGNMLRVACGGVCCCHHAYSQTLCTAPRRVLCPHVPSTQHSPSVNPHLLPLPAARRSSPSASPLPQDTN